MGSRRESSNLQKSGAALMSPGGSPRSHPQKARCTWAPSSSGGSRGWGGDCLKETYKFGLTPQLPNRLQTPEALFT